MLRKIGISEDKAERLMRIGRNEALSNSASLRNLPAAFMALYELSRMDPDDLEQGITDGEVTPDMKIWQAKEYARGGSTHVRLLARMEEWIIQQNPRSLEP